MNSNRRKVTVEELIAIATKPPYVPKKHTEIELFFKATKAQPSDTQYTNNMIVYYVYYKWCRRRGKTPANRKDFFKMLRVHVKEKQPKPKGYRAHHIVSEAFNLNDLEMIKAKKLQDKHTGNIYRGQKEIKK